MMILPLQNIASALKKADLIGTKFVKQGFVPSVFLHIEFETGEQAQLGNLLTPDQAGGRNGAEPRLGFLVDPRPYASPRWTVISVDCDAPSKTDQSMSPWRHWIRYDISAFSLDNVIEEKEKLKAQGSSEDKKLDLWIDDEKSKGKILTEWAGPSPGAGTGPHRYLFFLYLQKSDIKPISEQSSIKSNERIDRRHFDIETFVEENELELVGANFFLCENPETN